MNTAISLPKTDLAESPEQKPLTSFKVFRPVQLVNETDNYLRQRWALFNDGAEIHSVIHTPGLGEPLQPAKWVCTCGAILCPHLSCFNNRKSMASVYDRPSSNAKFFIHSNKTDHLKYSYHRPR